MAAISFGSEELFKVLKNDTSIQVFNCDTLVNNTGSQSYFFSTKEENYNGCFLYSNYSSYFDNYHDYIRPNLINSINDTLYFSFGTMNSLNTDSFVFYPKVQLGSSWFSPINNNLNNYNLLKFTCDNIYLDTIVGNIIDSVKLISIQAFNNSNPVTSIFDNQKIILSKNYGYKQLVSFSGQNQHPIQIIGIDFNTTQQGFYYPDFNDYFHLNLGDIIIWKEHFNGDIGNPSYTYYYKDSLIESFISTDSVYYKFNRQKAYGSSYLHNFNTTRNKLSWLNNSTTILKNFKTINSTTPNDLNHLSPIYLSNNILTREYFFDGLYLDTTNCLINTAACIGTIERYDTKVGLNHQSFTAYYTTEFTVIGSTINGIQEGVAWSTLVTGINDIENISDIKIYPNPSKSGNFILESEKALSLTIVSVDGKTVYTQNTIQPKTEVKTNLPKGLYFVHLELENNKKVIQKLIITD